MPEAFAHAAARLQRIPRADLLALAQGEAPPALQGRHAEDALPPAFVAVRALRLQAEAAARGEAGGLAGALYYVLEGESDGVVGSCGFKDAAQDGWVEIGYGLAASHRQRGLGTQAVAALTELALESGHVQCVRACIEPDNAPSAALARRLGFVPGPLVTEEDGSIVVVWTLTRPPGWPGPRAGPVAEGGGPAPP